MSCLQFQLHLHATTSHGRITSAFDDAIFFQRRYDWFCWTVKEDRVNTCKLRQVFIVCHITNSV